MFNNSSRTFQTTLNIDDPPQFNYERERLKTFENWQVTFISPQDMAAAGFYFLEREDIVRCAFCGVEVGSWVEGDDPMDDHKRWSPLCKFMKNLPVGNVPLNSNSTNDDDDKKIGFDTCGRTSKEELGIHKKRAPSFPDYITIESRLQSYETWPKELKRQNPNTLSEAGFFYTGRGDQTICFHCGGGLQNWEESDDPWFEHARWFSKCNFINLMKSDKSINSVCKKTDEPINHSSDNLIEEGNEKSLCKICYTDDVGVVFLPCGHLVVCVKCSLYLTSCAVCRKTVVATVRVYLS